MIKIISTYFVIFCFAFASSAQSFPLKEAPFPDRYSEVDEFDSQCIIYPDYFEDNRNGWDLFSDKKSSVRIENGRLILESLQSNGASRIIRVPELSVDYSFEVKMDFSKMKSWAKAGLIFGFKDWANYQFFIISSDRLSIGKMIDGVLILNRDDYYTVDIRKKEENILKVLSVDGNMYFALNGRVQLQIPQRTVAGNGFGVVTSRYSGQVSFDDFNYKVMKKLDGAPAIAQAEDAWGKMTGLGLIFTKEGFVLTSHNVVKDAESIAVEVVRDKVSRTYNAQLVYSNPMDDLALLQIVDSSFIPLDTIPFSFDRNPGVLAPKTIYTFNAKRRMNEFYSGLVFSEGNVIKVVEMSKAKMPEFGWKRVKFNKPAQPTYSNKFRTSFNVYNSTPGAPIFDQRGQLVGLVHLSDDSSDIVAESAYMSHIRDMLRNAPVTLQLPSSGSTKNLVKNDEGRLFSQFVTIIKVK